MNDQNFETEPFEKVDRKILRSPLLLITAILFASGAILSVISLVRLFDPNHIREIIYGLAAQDIVDPAAYVTWLMIIVLGKALFALFALTFTVGLGSIIISNLRYGEEGSLKGLAIIGKVSLVTAYIWYGFSGVVGVVFVVRFVRYILWLLSEVEEFLFPLIAMVSGEIVMLLVAAVLVYLIVKFLKETADLAYQSYYMLQTGNAESHVDPFCYIAFAVLAALCAYIVKFLSYDILAIVCFSALGVASLLMSICIRLFKGKIERIKYKNYKIRKKSEEIQGS